MRYEYDPMTDILLIKISKGKINFGKQSGNTIIHHNKIGFPVEIEILDASREVVEIVDVMLSKRKEKKKPTSIVNCR